MMLRRLQESGHGGDNVWLEFKRLAADYSPVNLSQGFPDFPPPKFLREALSRAGAAAHQYTRSFGHPRLVKSLAKFFSRVMGRELDPFEDIVVTFGAFQSLFCAFQTLLEEGDEVIIIEPFFTSYSPLVILAGGKPVYVPLRPAEGKAGLSSGDWVFSAEELASKFTPRTKAIIVNNPNNPVGKVYKLEELQMIADLCIKHDVLCISDDVYEWLTYDGTKHVKIATLPGMWERTITISSGGKSFSATGWKIGWVIGSSHIIKQMQQLHDNTVHQCPTITQEAVAEAFEREYEVFGTPESYFQQLPEMLQHKRTKLAACLESVGLQPIMPEGGYFMIADFSSFKMDFKDQISEDRYNDYKFAKWLIREKGLATIPVSAFYSPEHKEEFDKYIRVCFVKEDSTLDAAEAVLRKWSQGQ